MAKASDSGIMPGVVLAEDLSIETGHFLLGRDMSSRKSTNASSIYLGRCRRRNRQRRTRAQIPGANRFGQVAGAGQSLTTPAFPAQRSCICCCANSNKLCVHNLPCASRAGLPFLPRNRRRRPVAIGVASHGCRAMLSNAGSTLFLSLVETDRTVTRNSAP